MHEHIPAEEELVDDGNPREPICEKCGDEMEWADCYEIDCEDGSYDGYEEDPTWYDPGEWVKCSTCEGKGGWWICVRCSPEIDHG